MTGDAGSRRIGRRLPKLIVAVVLVVGGLVVTADTALAAPVVRARPTLPASVTVGDTNVAATLTVVNESTSPDTAYGWNVTSLKFAPSCTVSTTTGCTTPDPGVFSTSATGTGQAGTACAGTVFAFGAPDANGVQTITPTPIHLGAPGTGTASCVINFTVNVLKLPVDNNGGSPGAQTDAVGFVSATADNGSGLSTQAVSRRGVTVNPGAAPHGELRVTTNPALPSQILIGGVPRDSFGLNWLDLPPGSYTVSFTHVEGWTEPAPQTVNVMVGQTTTVQGNFVQRGSLRVITSPAVPATITVDGVPRDDWGMWTDLPTGSHSVCFGPVQGFNPPACQNNVMVIAGNLTTVTGTYTANAAAPGPSNVGELRVTSSPSLPTQILVNGTPRDTFGLNWLDLAPGAYTVSFTHVEGFTEPAPQTVNVMAGQTTTVQGTFVPRTSLRVITNPAVPGTISVDGIPRDDWGMWTDIPAGAHQVCFGPVPNFVAPACSNVNLVAGVPFQLTGNYAPA
jgi:hypothetical protein